MDGNAQNVDLKWADFSTTLEHVIYFFWRRVVVVKCC